MLRDLSRALYEAISDSSEVGESLRRIRREGYTLHLLLDCKREDGETVETGSLTPDVPERERSSRSERTQRDPLAAPVADMAPEPVFRINGQDLGFLRSIGIDPTRRRRRRKAE